MMRSALVLVGVVGLAGCMAPQQAPVIHQMACPAVPATPLGLPPPPKPPVSSDRLTLAPGHWDWQAQSYVWVEPRWMPRLSENPPLWLYGFWSTNGGGCAWTPGHFIQ